MILNIDPMVDCVFKALFADEGNQSLLINFLNAVLDREGEPRLTEVTVLNPFNEREFIGDKLTVVDVKAQDANGHTYQIEVQRGLPHNLTKRMVYTWARLHSKQLVKGEHFHNLKPTVAIWVLDQALFPNLGTLHHRLRLYDPQTTAYIEDENLIHLLEVSKAKPGALPDSELGSWIQFFREGGCLDTSALPSYLETTVMRKAVETLRTFTEQERREHLYERRLIAGHIEATRQYEMEMARQVAEDFETVKKELGEAQSRLEEQELKAQEQELKAQEEAKQRAKAETRADTATQQLAQLQAKLKELGIDPESM